MPVFHGQHSSTNELFDVNFFRKWRFRQRLHLSSCLELTRLWLANAAR